MLGEIHRHAEHRRLVEAADETVDDTARNQLQVVDAGQHHRVDEALSWKLFFRGRHDAPLYMPEAGTGTASSRRSMIWSVPIFSDSA